MIFNIVSGNLHDSNVVVLSPKMGLFAARFVETGAAVRFGNLSTLLDEIKDVFCIICNTIMTAQHVVDMAKRPHPVIWILHEWWDDELIKENLKIRNISGLSLSTIKEALKVASCTVFVCEAQRRLYNPTSLSTVIYVGVPPPPNNDENRSVVVKSPAAAKDRLTRSLNKRLQTAPTTDVFTFLSLGIVCPRKNQIWAVELFKEFAGDRQDVRMLIVGARYCRDYEIQYVEKVKAAINNDPRIDLHDVTENVDKYYQVSNFISSYYLQCLNKPLKNYLIILYL